MTTTKAKTKHKEMDFDAFEVSMKEMREKLRESPYAYRHCRNCENFMRVRKHYPGALEPRGFCRIGEGSGNFGLFISSSVAQSCQSFMLDARKFQITRFEQYLSDLRDDGYDTIKEEFDALMDKKGNPIRGIFVAREAAHKRFVSDHYDKLDELRRLCDFDEKEYLKFLDMIALSFKAWMDSNREIKT